MTATYKQPGDSIDYTPTSDVAAGDVVVQNDLVGVAKLDITADALGALALTGVFEVPKATGAIDTGEHVYWDADGDPVEGDAGTGAATTTATSNIYLGLAIIDAASDDVAVRFKLEQSGIDCAVAATQADSTASDVAGVVTDLNALLAKLQAAGLMASA